LQRALSVDICRRIKIAQMGGEPVVEPEIFQGDVTVNNALGKIVEIATKRSTI